MFPVTEIVSVELENWTYAASADAGPPHRIKAPAMIPNAFEILVSKELLIYPSTWHELEQKQLHTVIGHAGTIPTTDAI